MVIRFDVMLPELNGFEVLRRLQRQKATPVIMLTALGQINDKVSGLGLAIAKWIVDNHKAYFEVTSRQDIGTRIKIVF